MDVLVNKEFLDKDSSKKIQRILLDLRKVFYVYDGEEQKEQALDDEMMTKQFELMASQGGWIKFEDNT